jgi:hypothetical protein
MITAFKLAGFFAAHAICTVSEHDTFSPMLAFTKEDGERSMMRLIGEDIPALVGLGKERLESNDMDANDAVLVFDGRITLGTEKVDAVILEMRAYFAPNAVAVIAIPYTPASSGQFRVHKPKLLAWENCDDFDIDAAFKSFFEGVDEHEDGAKIWNAALDESR